MNDEEIKKEIDRAAAKAGNVIGGALLFLAIVILVIGVCWAGAWVMVSTL